MVEKRIKILFILPSLVPGGAERILSYVAQELDKNVFDTTLLVTGYEADTVYNLKNLKIVYLNKPRVLKSYGAITKYIKQNKPEIVVTAIVHLNTLAAFISLRFPKIKFIARETNVLTSINNHNPHPGSYFPNSIVKIAYKLIDKIICQSKDMQQDIIENYGISEKKTVLINNPITQKYQVKTNNRVEQDSLKFITVGRLGKEKGHDRILDALSKISFKFTYTIIGDGSEKEALFNKIKLYKLENVIEYISYTDRVSNYLTDSDLFLQGSYVEGFPNVILESCVVGTPVLAFKAPGGLAEIVQTGQNGYIANNMDEYVEFLNNLNTNFIFNPQTVSETVIKKFDSKVIIGQYEDLFRKSVK